MACLLLITLLVVSTLATPAGLAQGVAPSDWVEGTSALDDGATRDYYNRAAGLAWNFQLGDWRDRNGLAQGPAAYAAVAMFDDNTPETIEWEVTSLVQSWVAGDHDNQGILLGLSSGSATYKFRSREHSVASERPKLVVTTTAGPADYAASADTYVDSSTYRGFGDSDTLRVASGSHTLLRFDLSPIPAGTTVLDARLRLFVYAEYGSAEVGVYRSEQGHDEPGTDPILGLAGGYASDRGIAGHPSVLLVSDFEGADWGNSWSFGTTASTPQRILDDPSRQFAPLQGYALRVQIPAGANTGMNVGFRFAEETGSEPEEIYFRYYIRISDDWQTLDGGKFPGPSGTYGVAGWGGRRSDGTE